MIKVRCQEWILRPETSDHFSYAILNCLQVYVPQNIHDFFTSCIKSQEHFSDEYFFGIIVCTNWKNFFLRCLKYVRQKSHVYFFVKCFTFFDMYLKTYMDIFSYIFKMVTPRAVRKFLLFIKLNCLTNATFIANFCGHLIPIHYKTSTTYILKFDAV